MYLTHLATDRGLPVYDPRTSAVVLWATEDVIKRLMGEAKVKPIFGAKHCIRALHWVGVRLTIVPIPEEVAGYKPSNWKPIAYVYDFENDLNPKNCWSLFEIHTGDCEIFLAVAASCGAPIKRSRTNKRGPVNE